MLNRSAAAWLKRLLGSVILGSLFPGCLPPPAPSAPIPLRWVLAAPASVGGDAGRPLVIVLPGRGDDLDDLTASGIAVAVQRAWPQADVLLAGATLSYYVDGKVAARLHDQVLAPARARGYRRIWLAGASMGGMGALLYERSYPRDVTGLVLMAPYMGEPGLIREVAAAGGPARWAPGPAPAAVDSGNYQRELWRMVKSWGTSPVEAERIWLACGKYDRFIQAATLVASQLPPGHFILVPGDHDWPSWDAGAEQAFARIAARQGSISSTPSSPR